MCKGAPSNAALAGKQTLIWREGPCVCLRLLRRKNRLKGSGVLKRECTCSGGCIDTCVVHTLWDRFLAHLPDGHEPWKGFTANQARCRLRLLLATLRVCDVNDYGTHDFRRGHAEVRIRLWKPALH